MDRQKTQISSLDIEQRQPLLIYLDFGRTRTLPWVRGG